MDKQIPPPPLISVPEPPKKITEDQIVYLDNGFSVPPPSAIEFEEVVLGAMMIDTKGVEEVFHLLSSGVFYVDKHKRIFEAIEKLVEEKTGIDLLTVIDKLKKMGTLKAAGGEFYLIQLTQKVSSSAHIEFHTRIILQKYVLRELIKSSRKTLFQSLHKDPDIFSLLGEIETMVTRVNQVAIKRNTNIKKEDAKTQLVKKVSDVKSGKGSGLYLGVSEFDEWSGGIQDRELITFAARTGMGKTNITLAIAIFIAIVCEKRVSFFSLEMSKIEIIYRVASNLTGIPFSEIRKGTLSPSNLKKVLEAIDYINNSCLIIYDTSDHKNYFDQIEKLIREESELESKLIVIDYVQLVKLREKSSDRTGDLSSITRDLKALNNELSIPFFQLAQISRSTDGRAGSKIPLLSDLKQSGSIEEDSDMVIFYVRDAYYAQEKNSTIELPPQKVGDTQMVVAKGRSTGTRAFRTFIDFIAYKFTSYSDSGY